MDSQQTMEMQQQCIFCQIISGQIQSKKVYEDSKFTVILDINPANPGHCVILPKEHYSVMPQLPDQDLYDLSLLIRKISQSMLKTLGAKGTNVHIANGVAAGQRSSHFLVHIFPRVPNDGVAFQIPQTSISDEDFIESQTLLVGILNKMFGTNIEVTGKKPTVSSAPVQKEPEKVINEPKKGDLDDIAKFLLKK